MRTTKQNLTLDTKFLRYINKLFTKKTIVRDSFTTNQIQQSKGIDIAAEHLDNNSFLVIKKFFPKSLLTNVNMTELPSTNLSLFISKISEKMNNSKTFERSENLTIPYELPFCVFFS